MKKSIPLLFSFLFFSYSFSAYIDQIIPKDSSLILVQYTPLQIKVLSKKEFKERIVTDKGWKKIRSLKGVFYASYFTKGHYRNHLVYDGYQDLIYNLDSNFNIINFYPLPNVLKRYTGKCLFFFWRLTSIFRFFCFEPR